MNGEQPGGELSSPKPDIQIMDAKTRQADKRLQRTYGITLEEYNQMLAGQGNKCAICFRKPENIRLAVDHLHHPKIELTETENMVKTKYMSVARVGKNVFASFGCTKVQAVQNLKKMYKKHTVRGLLCGSCNRALGKVEDPRWQWGPAQLRSAADYLERFNNGKAS